MHVFLFEKVVLFTEKASKQVPEYKCIYFEDVRRKLFLFLAITFKKCNIDKNDIN